YGARPPALAAPSFPRRPFAGVVMKEMRPIEGWLSDEEADLLISASAQALCTKEGAVVEVGSYCGKATLVLGRVAEAVRPEARVHAIDPHDGLLGARDRG